MKKLDLFKLDTTLQNKKYKLKQEYTFLNDQMEVYSDEEILDFSKNIVLNKKIKKSRRKIRKICPIWDDAVETSSKNKPKFVRFRNTKEK